VSNLVQISEGGFGLIYSCTDSRGSQFALKKCAIQRQESFDTVQKEVQILKRFKECKYIVKIFGEHISMASGEACILLEMCHGGHLLNKLNKYAEDHSRLSAKEIYITFGQICSGLQVLHTAKPRFIVHRDIKCENILFGGPDNSIAKLCDFGSCVEGVTPLRDVAERNNAEEIISKETTVAYRAPEMVDLYMRNYLCEKTDMWAMGCLLYTLVFLKQPFQDSGALGILNGVQVPNSSGYEGLCTLITRMLDVDPEARPTIQQVINALQCLSSGRPLPAYEVPEEVLTFKKQREENAARREAKNKAAEKSKRGMAGILANRKSNAASFSGNSVAARRLAQMRGGAGGDGDFSSGGSSASFPSDGGANDFNPFSDSSPASGSSADPFTVGSPKNNTISVDDFFNDAPASSISASVSTFADNNSNIDFGTGNDAFADDSFGRPVNSAMDSFGNISNTNINTTNVNSDPFAAATSNSTADSFGGNDFAPSGGAGAATDLFATATSSSVDSFAPVEDNFSAFGSPTKEKVPSIAAFDNFDSTGTSESESNSDGFGYVPPTDAFGATEPSTTSNTGSVIVGGSGGGGGLGKLFAAVVDENLDADFGGPVVSSSSAAFNDDAFGAPVLSPAPADTFGSGGLDSFTPTGSTSYDDFTNGDDDGFNNLPSAPASRQSSIRIPNNDAANLIGNLTLNDALENRLGRASFSANGTPAQAQSQFHADDSRASFSGMDDDLFGPSDTTSTDTVGAVQAQVAPVLSGGGSSSDVLSLFDADDLASTPMNKPVMMNAPSRVDALSSMGGMPQQQPYNVSPMRSQQPGFRGGSTPGAYGFGSPTGSAMGGGSSTMGGMNRFGNTLNSNLNSMGGGSNMGASSFQTSMTAAPVNMNMNMNMNNDMRSNSNNANNGNFDVFTMPSTLQRNANTNTKSSTSSNNNSATNMGNTSNRPNSLRLDPFANLGAF